MNKRTFSAGAHRFGAGERVCIIAEIGTGHNGDPLKAQRLIDAAREAGADCVKFQMVYAEEILHPMCGDVPLPTGNIPLFNRFRDLELPLDFYIRMAQYARERDMLFLCTPFGLRSARDLRTVYARSGYSTEEAWVKIASPELNHTELLSEVASFDWPIVLSTGVSRMSDIERALECTEKTTGDRALLHCVTSYPAPEQDYNLHILDHLSGLFNIAVGVSDHSLDPVLVPTLATACGACIVEKHICLSRTDPGLDDPVALPPDQFALMCKRIRRASAEGRERTIRSLEEERGKELIDRILGTGEKKLARSELANYGRTNRSLHYLRDLSQGTILERKDFAALRTEKILSPGIHPDYTDLIEGAVLARNVNNGDGIRLEDIIVRSADNTRNNA